jgi:hypothetical protein
LRGFESFKYSFIKWTLPQIAKLDRKDRFELIKNRKEVRGKAELRKVKYLWGVRRNAMGYGMHKLSLY